MLLEQCLGIAEPVRAVLAEMSYQFTAPFVLDSSHSEALLGLKATAFDTTVQATVDRWWEQQG